MSLSSQKNLHILSLVIGTILIAAVSARPYAGSWNDGSRLAAVESLVDYHTWSIDQSVFVRTPGIVTKHRDLAYPADDPLLREVGTMDKLYIKDRDSDSDNYHYYSDKSPLPTLIMSGVYRALQTATGLSAGTNPRLFCYLMALIFSGGAYVFSVCCMDATANLLGLSWKPRLLISWSFALATIALPYAREVNNHIMLLAVFCAIMFLSVSYTQPGEAKQWRLAVIGSLMGIGYPIDLGTGPVLVLCVTGLIAVQTRSVKDVALVLFMSFPWFLVHHLVNYKIGGTFKPANAVTDYFLWPGSPFNAGNLTGGWSHKGVWDFLVYTAALIIGKKGLICHDLALYLSIPAIVFLVKNKTAHRALVWYSLALILGTWLIYAVTSNNYSGACCSIRWFVPLLAPFYFLLAVFLKERPEFTGDLLVLSAWGAAMGAVMWFKGPWMQHMVPGFWVFQGGALLSWVAWRFKCSHSPVQGEAAGGERKS